MSVATQDTAVNTGRIARTFIYLVLLLAALFYLLPIYVMAVNSVKPLAEITGGNMLALPQSLTFQPWRQAWATAQIGVEPTGLKPYFLNSTLMVVPAVLISTVVGALNGYVLTKWRFRGDTIIFGLMLFACFIPFQIVLIPMATVLGKLGIAGTVPGLVLVHVVYGIGFTTLYYRNYDASFPTELALGVGGADFYRRALVDLDDAALRGMIDKNAPGRDWNLASAMVINGEAAMQIMGDWAKGEFTNAGKVSGTDYACIPMPKANGPAGFGYLVNSLSLFTQTDPDLIKGQEVLASAIMDPAVQVAFNKAKGAIPARMDADMTGLDACAQATAADLAVADATGTAVPTFAGTHAANATIGGAATDAITGFFNSDMTADAGATALADAIMAAR